MSKIISVIISRQEHAIKIKEELSKVLQREKLFSLLIADADHAVIETQCWCWVKIVYLPISFNRLRVFKSNTTFRF